MAWGCQKCGACCREIPKLLGLGCRAYNPETKQCGEYENRPPVCRYEVFGVSEEVQEASCKKLREGDIDGFIDIAARGSVC